MEIAPRLTPPPFGRCLTHTSASARSSARHSRRVHVQELAVRVHVWQECVSASKADGAARPMSDGGTGPNLAFTIFAGCQEPSRIGCFSQ